MKNLNKTFLFLAVMVISWPTQAQIITDSLHASDGTLTYAKFDLLNQPVPQSKAMEVTRRLLQMQSDDELKLINTVADDLAYEHLYYQQFYKGLKVEGVVYATHAVRGMLESINGTFARVKFDELRPGITESQALSTALHFMPAETYKWEESGTALPKAELLIAKDRLKSNSVYRLAYKFIIEAAAPPVSKAIYVDAQTGEVIQQRLLTQNIHPFVNGLADTRYSGSRKINTEAHLNGFRLRETRESIARGSTVRIETMNMYKKGTNYQKAYDFTDNDNNWTALEFDNEKVDNAALDVHWGTEKTFDYFLQVLGRFSINGVGSPIYSYVHFYKNWENAQWDGSYQVMRYGDGYQGSHPFTSLDIIAHEIGHGVCQNTPYGGLIYEGESGALNEGFSDIWSASIERHCAPEKQNWLIGEEVVKNGLRNLANPNDIKALSQCPDTYGGKYWKNPLLVGEENDYGGVHINSTIIGHWFYLLCNGGKGVNDLGNSFELEGIDRMEAARIAYRAERLYLKPDANFNDARVATIHAADHLFGVLSPQSKKVAHAWYAVGVGDFSQKQGPTHNVPTQPVPIEGLEPMPINNKYQIAPNPATDMIKISANDRDASGSIIHGFEQLQVLDMSGKLKKQQQFSPNTFEVQLNVSDLLPGIYHLRIFDGKNWSVQKLMIR